MSNGQSFDDWFDRQVNNGTLGLHGTSQADLQWMRSIMRTTFNAGRQSGYQASGAQQAMKECALIAEKHYITAQLAVEMHNLPDAKHGAIAAKAIAHEIRRSAELSLLGGDV